MTKPVIVTRASKQLALSYNELDQNFVNLQNATIGFRLPGIGSEPARTAKTVTAFGDAVVSTVQKKFGLGSLALDGTGDYVTINSNVDFAYGTGDFTIEMWIYRTVSGITQVLLDQRTDNPTNYAPVIFINASNALQYNDGAASVITGTTTVPLNAWSHVALSRSGTSTRLFLNGVQQGTTYTDTRNYIATPVTIGARFNNTQNFTGYIDEVRVTKGLARYTANFTSTTEAFTNDSNTVLLLHFDTDLTDDTGFVAVEDTVVDIDLNSRLTFVAGTGISLDLDTATDTLTINSNAETNSITQGNSNVTVTDTGTGQIDFTVDGTAVMQLKSTGLTAYRETVYAGGNTSTAITPNYANGNIQTFTANSNFTLNLPTNMAAGQNLVLIITQDATGSRVMTSNSGYKFVNGIKKLTTTANAIDVLSVFYDGSRYLCNLSKGYV